MIEVGTLRGIATLLAFVAFVAIVAWAWSGRRKSQFDAAARMPLDDDSARPGGN